MLRNEFNSLEYYTFDSFPKNKVIHGIFSRHGGVSQGPFSSLNVSESSGDSRENVVQNRQRIFNVFSRSIESIHDVWQIHSEKVITAKSPRKPGVDHVQADAILTDSKDVSLFMQFADCVPILIYDPTKNVVGTIHAGWQGTVKRIVQHAIQEMKSKYLCNPKDIIAGIGPSIGPDHYEIGNNVIIEVHEKLSEIKEDILITRNGKTFFDLWKSNELLLKQMGVEQIEVSEICTACNTNQWFSYRSEGQQTGRFGVLLSLK